MNIWYLSSITSSLIICPLSEIVNRPAAVLLYLGLTRAHYWLRLILITLIFFITSELLVPSFYNSCCCLSCLGGELLIILVGIKVSKHELLRIHQFGRGWWLLNLFDIVMILKRILVTLGLFKLMNVFLLFKRLLLQFLDLLSSHLLTKILVEEHKLVTFVSLVLN